MSTSPDGQVSRTLTAPVCPDGASGAAGRCDGGEAACDSNIQNGSANVAHSRRVESPTGQPRKPQSAVTLIRKANKTRGEMVRCPLILCPEVPKGTRFAFVLRGSGPCDMKIESGLLTETAPSLNLAGLRQRGAQLGAQHVVLILPQGYVFSMTDLR
ncbi:MAG: hypothetical protein H6875_12255 [Hyphomicrobiaceae bacterium]|nr:hypothetical protein [Hyphomicrobiaceae bacterium]